MNPAGLVPAVVGTRASSPSSRWAGWLAVESSKSQVVGKGLTESLPAWPKMEALECHACVCPSVCGLEALPWSHAPALKPSHPVDCQ